MILHADRCTIGAPTRRNGVVVHDSEGQEGVLPWGQQASAQLIAMLATKGDRTTSSGSTYGSGYQAVATETGSFVQVGDDNVGPYHCGTGINTCMWSICIPGKASQTRAQWLGDVSREYIRGAARYIVDRWNHDGRVWPLEFRSGAQLRADQANVRNHPSGYTSHAQVTVSKLTSTNHSDPGPGFPWDVLRADIEALVGVKPAPSPEQPPTQEILDMSRLYRKTGKNAVWLADGVTRIHVPSEAHLATLTPPLPNGYGPVIEIAADTDLDAQLGKQRLSFTGDV